VSKNQLIGANRRYVDQHLPHLSSVLVDSLDQLLTESEVIVLGHGSEQARAATRAARSGQVILDLIGVGRGVPTSAQYVGMSW